MIASNLKTIVTQAGCTLVVYESDKIANLKLDVSNQNDIIGLIIQPNEVKLKVLANAIMEHYPLFYIEVIQQVRLEDAADTNEYKLSYLLNVCKKIILYLIYSGDYKQIKPMTVAKIQENKYDANVIGWSMPLDLVLLKNESKDPCYPYLPVYLIDDFGNYITDLAGNKIILN
jgi:hypothetical protein